MFGVPLLILSFAIYNIIAILTPGLALDKELWHFRLASEGEFGITGGDIIVAGSILILLMEMAKAARGRGLVEHFLALLHFAGMVAEFLLVRQAASTTFAMLLVISFADVMGGIAVSRRAARRAVPVIAVDRDHSS
jgi:hypothetical protein